MTTAVEQFWGETVLAGPFETLEESDASLRVRSELYPGLEELMPTDHPGKIVLDYGCGPGHDTLLLIRSGAYVYFADVSKKALEITEARIRMHGFKGGKRWHVYDSGPMRLPSVDYIHCAGVLHHVSDPASVLSSFKTALRPSGEVRLMVYDGDRSEHTQSEVPVTEWWGERDIERMARAAGFDAEYLGSYECSAEWRPNCYAACYRLC